MTNVADEKLKQLPFEFALEAHMGREDFMVSSCNQKAFEFIENWPNWLSSGLFIYGPHGCGKSHLAHLFVEKIQSAANGTCAIAIMEARGISMRNIHRLIHENIGIVVENVSSKCNDEALFHLFNAYNQDGRYMLWTGEQAPHYMRFALPDLQSRFNMLPCVEIREPDDVMMQILVVKLFNDRQLLISPEILNYIVSNAERSFSYIQRLVAELDALSLAYQCAVNYNMVKQAMALVRQQIERTPDLFGDW